MKFNEKCIYHVTKLNNLTITTQKINNFKNIFENNLTIETQNINNLKPRPIIPEWFGPDRF